MAAGIFSIPFCTSARSADVLHTMSKDMPYRHKILEIQGAILV